MGATEITQLFVRIFIFLLGGWIMSIEWRLRKAVNGGRFDELIKRMEDHDEHINSRVDKIEEKVETRLMRIEDYLMGEDKKWRKEKS